MPKIIKIDLYNSELYRFKVGAFFETQCSPKVIGAHTLNFKPNFRCSPVDRHCQR